jgi:hypothetical protein
MHLFFYTSTSKYKKMSSPTFKTYESLDSDSWTILDQSSQTDQANSTIDMNSILDVPDIQQIQEKMKAEALARETLFDDAISRYEKRLSNKGIDDYMNYEPEDLVFDITTKQFHIDDELVTSEPGFYYVGQNDYRHTKATATLSLTVSAGDIGRTTDTESTGNNDNTESAENIDNAVRRCWLKFPDSSQFGPNDIDGIQLLSSGHEYTNNPVNWISGPSGFWSALNMVMNIDGHNDDNIDNSDMLLIPFSQTCLLPIDCVSPDEFRGHGIYNDYSQEWFVQLVFNHDIDKDSIDSLLPELVYETADANLVPPLKRSCQTFCYDYEICDVRKCIDDNHDNDNIYSCTPFICSQSPGFIVALDSDLEVDGFSMSFGVQSLDYVEQIDNMTYTEVGSGNTKYQVSYQFDGDNIVYSDNVNHKNYYFISLTNKGIGQTVSKELVGTGYDTYEPTEFNDVRCMYTCMFGVRGVIFSRIGDDFLFNIHFADSKSLVDGTEIKPTFMSIKHNVYRQMDGMVGKAFAT